jgi:hypothetical protein
VLSRSPLSGRCAAPLRGRRGLGRAAEPPEAVEGDVAALIELNAIAFAAALCVFYEKGRAARKRPIAERWKRFAGVSRGIAAILAYFNGPRFEPAGFYHRHDQFHYYLGAKFFPELGYAGLYKCTLIAQDELGVVTFTNEATGRPIKIDMSKEVRHPDRKLRNLSGDNLLMPASEFLPHAEECTRRFSPERWAAFRRTSRSSGPNPRRATGRKCRGPRGV